METEIAISWSFVDLTDGTAIIWAIDITLSVQTAPCAMPLATVYTLLHAPDHVQQLKRYQSRGVAGEKFTDIIFGAMLDATLQEPEK